MPMHIIDIYIPYNFIVLSTFFIFLYIFTNRARKSFSLKFFEFLPNSVTGLHDGFAATKHRTNNNKARKDIDFIFYLVDRRRRRPNNNIY